MKRASVKYICNGYTVELTGDPAQVQPTPLIRYATTVAEVVYWLADFFEGAPRGVTPAVAPFTPTSRASASVDPLINQEAIIFPTTDPGYIVREMTSPYVPTRPVLDEFCPSMDAVAQELGEIYSDGSVIPPLADGDFTLDPSVDSGGGSGAIDVEDGPGQKVEHYRMNVNSQFGQDIYEGATHTGISADEVAALIEARVNGDGAGHMDAARSGNRVNLTPRDPNNKIVTIAAGLVNGVTRSARAQGLRL